MTMKNDTPSDRTGTKPTHAPDTQPEGSNTLVIDTSIPETWNSMVLRLNMLMTHWQYGMDYTEVRMQEANTILKRWLKVAEPSKEECPTEVYECLSDNLNYIKAIALMHGYCKRKEGKKLFSAMHMLGLFGNPSFPSDWRVFPREANTTELKNVEV